MYLVTSGGCGCVRAPLLHLVCPESLQECLHKPPVTVPVTCILLPFLSHCFFPVPFPSGMARYCSAISLCYKVLQRRLFVVAPATGSFNALRCIGVAACPLSVIPLWEAADWFAANFVIAWHDSFL